METQKKTETSEYSPKLQSSEPGARASRSCFFFFFSLSGLPSLQLNRFPKRFSPDGQTRKAGGKKNTHLSLRFNQLRKGERERRTG